jgi:hypothetical protein
MLRLIHSFDIKPGVPVESFIEWLDHELWARSEPFGCIERKTWIYLDGIDGTYEQGRPARRPRYLNEAFWPHQQAAEDFRKWLLSEDARDFRRRMFDGISNHTVLRYVDYSGRDTVGEE